MNHEKLTSKPVILYGRTHGHTKVLIDTICKNYKELKITNLEDEKKLKALEIIKNSGYISLDIMLSQNYITRKEYDLLKEVLYEKET